MKREFNGTQIMVSAVDLLLDHLFEMQLNRTCKIIIE